MEHPKILFWKERFPERKNWTKNFFLLLLYCSVNHSIKNYKNEMMAKMSLIKKFINLLMIAGKKHAAYKLFFTAGSQFLHLMQKSKHESNPPPKNLTHAPSLSLPGWLHKRSKPGKGRTTSSFHSLRKAEGKEKAISPSNNLLFYLHTAIKHVQPSLEGRKCRVAGTTKLVPAVIPHKRGYALAVRWIIQSARNKKKGNRLPFHYCLAQEFLDAYQKQGRPRSRRDAFHKTCEGNRGFLRYRWW